MMAHRRRRLPPEPVVTVTPGDYLDEASRKKYEQQQAAAIERMEAFDAAPKPLRVLWDALSDEGLARRLYADGVRDVATAERICRLWTRRSG